jgi:glycosyltransferase involved in cell wall biosynthesis
VLDKVGGIFACNRLLAEQATAKLWRRVDYRHDGVPTDIYYPRGIKAEPVHPFTVGWSGNASLVEKQWHVAARVGRAVDEMGGRFVACGRGLPLWPCLPLQEMPGWFRGLSAYICTSSEDGGPNGPLEAAACGVPTVSFRCGAMTDFIISGTTGLLVDDEQEMVSALETLRSEYKAADGMSWTMRRDARLRAEEWSLDNWARYFLADVLT